MMAWVVRSAGFFSVMAVWALVFAPAGDAADSSGHLSTTTQDLTVEVLSPTVGSDGIWRPSTDRTAGTGELVSPWRLQADLVAVLLVAAGIEAARALRRRMRSRGRPLLAYPMAALRRGPPAITFV